MKLILNQNKLNEELFEAICDGDLLKTKELIANGANVNSKHPDYDYNICPCLYKSIIEEYIDIVEILLNAGADPNIPACEFIKDIEIFYYPIQAAVTTSNSSVAIVKLLIEHGLNLNSKFSQDAFLLICQNRFDHAIYMIECCRALIVAGIDLNYIDELEETALFLAATSNNIGITKLLIENGAKKNLASSFALDNYDEVTSIYQNSDKRVDNEAYILCKAVFFRNTTLIEKMLNFGVNINIPYQGSVGPKKTALTSTHNRFMREWLLKQGADPKVIIKTERANPLCDVIVSEDIEPFKLLLSSGADPNETSSDHTKTPILHLAVSYSSPLEKSKRLLFYGADIHAKDVLQRSVMHAILNQQLSRANEYSEEDYEELEEEKLQVIDFLLFYNANPVPKDIRGNTPLHVAVVSGYSSVILEKLIAIGNNINEKNYYGETALSLAARSGNTKAVNYLIEQGAKKDLTFLICFDSQPNVLRRIKKVKFVEILDQEYNTLLHYAARRGFIDVIKELLHQGAKINLFNRSHQTPLDIAESNLQTEVFKYLAKEGGKTYGELSNNCIWDWCCGYWLPNTHGKIRLCYSFAGAKKDICNKYGFVKESIPLSFLQQNLAIKVMKYISDILNITFYKSRNIEEADLFIGQFSDKEIWNYSGAELKHVDHWIISKASIAINNYRFKDSTIESYPSFSFMNILQSFGRVLGLRYSKESYILYKNQSMLDEYYEVGFSRNDLEKLSSRYSFTR